MKKTRPKSYACLAFFKESNNNFFVLSLSQNEISLERLGFCLDNFLANVLHVISFSLENVGQNVRREQLFCLTRKFGKKLVCFLPGNTNFYQNFLKNYSFHFTGALKL